MDEKLFSRPLFLRMNKHLIQEIASLSDAIAFLLDWHQCQRDPVYDSTLRFCLEAHEGLKPPSAARKAMRRFARDKGILEDDINVMKSIAKASP